MSVIRVRKDANYFAASNEPFNDVRLSWDTRGLMGYLLSKPDHWEISVTDLVNKGPAKIFKVRRMLAEARKYGYMNRIRITKSDGTFDWITEIFESPSLNPGPSARFSTTGTSTRLSTSGKTRDIVSTDSSNDDNESKARAISERTKVLAKLYSENIGAITALGADMIRNMAIDYTEVSWYKPAFEVAVGNNARSLNYVDAVLRGWLDHYFGWKPGFNGNDNGGKGKRQNKSNEKQPNQPKSTPEDVEKKRAEIEVQFRKEGLIQ